MGYQGREKVPGTFSALLRFAISLGARVNMICTAVYRGPARSVDRPVTLETIRPLGILAPEDAFP